MTEALFSRRGLKLAGSWAVSGLALAWLAGALTVPVSVVLVAVVVVAIFAVSYSAGWVARGRAAVLAEERAGGGR